MIFRIRRGNYPSSLARLLIFVTLVSGCSTTSSVQKQTLRYATRGNLEQARVEIIQALKANPADNSLQSELNEITNKLIQQYLQVAKSITPYDLMRKEMLFRKVLALGVRDPETERIREELL